jgi:hypothetical protein
MMPYLLQIQWGFDHRQVLFDVPLQCGDINWLSHRASHDDLDPIDAEAIDLKYARSLSRGLHIRTIGV